MIDLVLGGARSGKSEVAETLAAEHGPDVIYIATASVTDDDFARRVDTHRARRPATWTTVECGQQLVGTLREAGTRPVLVDSLGTWIAATPVLEVNVDELLIALADRPAPTVIVSEEVGLGVHPETEVGRRWRDALGDANRAVASVADRVLLVVAGRVLEL